MGYDALVFIKKIHTLKNVEDLLFYMGYKKQNNMYICGKDKDYKYESGVCIWKEKPQDNNEYCLHVRTQIWCNGYDSKLFNDTLRIIRKHFDARFKSDYGINRYIPEKS